MAEEYDKWLDEDAAELLLRGEPLDAVLDASDTSSRMRAQRLAEALGAARGGLPPHGEPPAGEVPGEAAALAAFRQARAAAAAAPGAAAPGSVVGNPSDGLPARAHWGLRRRGARRLPVVRFAAAAALAACTLGGVAVAAGTGVLPTPFDGGGGTSGEPKPGASVSVAGTPPSHVSPHPSQPHPVESDGDDTDDAPSSGGSTEPTAPDGRTESPAPGASTPDDDQQDQRGEQDQQGGPSTRKPDPTDELTPEQKRDLYQRVVSVCRDYQSGKPLAADKRRLLERAANGAGNVAKLCDRALAAQGGGSDGAPRNDGADADDKDKRGSGGPGADRRPAPQTSRGAGKDQVDTAERSLDDGGSSVTSHLGTAPDGLAVEPLSS
ncbi:hypothetical protein [Streptomyces apocyni]|uniref:hypothetical protein n=1 Tax=Streptomyces apocyni TaxID=2654677 RepID=UPI0012EAC024|nr:hypothetical protein [Streptomyces apocyni]